MKYKIKIRVEYDKVIGSDCMMFYYKPKNKLLYKKHSFYLHHLCDLTITEDETKLKKEVLYFLKFAIWSDKIENKIEKIANQKPKQPYITRKTFEIELESR